MSIVVIGVNHRTRSARARSSGSRRPGSGWPRRWSGSRPAAQLARGRVVLSTCNRTEVYAVAEKFHGAYADIRDFLVRARPPGARRAAPAPLQPARRRRRRPPVRGRRRPRLGRARRERDPRPGPRRRGRSPQAEGGARPTLNLLFRHALERRQAGPHRDRDRSWHGIGQPRRGRDGRPTCSARSTGKRVLVVGAGDDGRGRRRRAARAPGPTDIRRRQPHDRARRSSSPTASAARVVPFDQLRSATRRRRRGAHVHRRRRAVVDFDRCSPRRDRSSPAAADRRHRRAPRRRAGGHRAARRDRCSTSTTFATGPIGVEPIARARRERVRDDRRRGGRAVRRSSVTARQAAPLVAALHDQAENVRAGGARALRRRGWPALDDAERDAVDALTRGIVAKLLHQPSRAAQGTTPARRRASATPLRCVDLFDLG